MEKEVVEEGKRQVRSLRGAHEQKVRVERGMEAWKSEAFDLRVELFFFFLIRCCCM